MEKVTEKQLESAMKKYLSDNSEARFSKLFNMLIHVADSTCYLEKLCTSRKTKNLFHMAKFYQLGNRLHEATFFLEKHFNSNRNDANTLLELQYIYAQRGDYNSSRKLILQMNEIEIGEVLYLRTVLIHFLAFGTRDQVIHISEEIGKHNNLDNFTLRILFEALMVTRNTNIINILKKYRDGRKILQNASPRDTAYIKSLLMGNFSCVLQLIGGSTDA
ncbi:hypothetical protein IE5_02220 [Bacillus cereus BAG3X2-2]|uniref:hypothetical protein n=1 Tax=Bacillus cereus TaxID=1396 RepID=UPI000279273B|nr:hypothetical protein [Bacillus cereus]EJQ21172.1 hypothetical protein IE5_02220 [Bacillus cereus BAG3X2-2]